MRVFSVYLRAKHESLNSNFSYSQRMASEYFVPQAYQIHFALPGPCNSLTIEETSRKLPLLVKRYPQQPGVSELPTLTKVARSWQTSLLLEPDA